MIATAASRPITPLTVVTLTVTAIAASIVPVLFGIAFIASALARRPLLATPSPRKGRSTRGGCQAGCTLIIRTRA